MRRSNARPCLLLLAALTGGALGGCYHHVIRDTGYNENNVTLYEPNVPDEPGPLEKFESAIWGDNQNQSKAKTVRGSPSSRSGG